MLAECSASNSQCLAFSSLSELPQASGAAELVSAYVGQPTSSALVPAGESKQYEEQKRHQRFQQATNPNTKGW